MKRILLILAACACACAWAGVMSARLGSLGRNDTVVTNVTDVTPGNYETVSNAAMSARGKTDLEVYAAETTPWTCSEVFASGDYSTMTNKSLWTFTAWEAGGEIYPTISYNGVVIGDCNSPIPDEDMPTSTEWPMFYDSDLYVTFRRHIAGMATGNRLATTNDIPRTAGDVGAYPAASGSALESGKQDRLPYPTNAIPYAAITGAPTLPSVFYDAAGGASTVSGATLTYQAASNSVGSVALLAGTNVLHITAPIAITGHVRDFGLTVTTEDAATITLDSSVSWRFDSASTNLTAGSWNRVYCTESPSGVFSLQLWTPDSAQEVTP